MVRLTAPLTHEWKNVHTVDDHRHSSELRGEPADDARLALVRVDDVRLEAGQDVDHPPRRLEGLDDADVPDKILDLNGFGDLAESKLHLRIRLSAEDHYDFVASFDLSFTRQKCILFRCCSAEAPLRM